MPLTTRSASLVLALTSAFAIGCQNEGGDEEARMDTDGSAVAQIADEHSTETEADSQSGHDLSGNEGGEAMVSTPDSNASDDSSYVLGHDAQTISGESVQMDSFKGSVVLVVNVASECGYTPQYAQLQQVYETYAEQGFTVVGFPANNFGGQEPGSNDQIAEFCDARFGVSFPMMGKVSVKGDDAHPMYAQLASMDAPIGGAPKWNFTKFLVDREGRVVARFEPGDRPDAPKVTEAIEALL